MSSDSGDEGGHEAAAAPAAAAPSKRGSKAAKQMSAKLLVEGIMDVVGTVLGACLNPDQVDKALDKAKKSPAFKHLISDLSSGAIALGGKGKGKGGGGGGGAPAGPKAIRHTYQAFTTVAMAALKEANRADLANMTTVGNTWKRLPANIRARVEERMTAIKDRYNNALAAGEPVGGLVEELKKYEAEEGLDPLNLTSYIEKYHEGPLQEGGGAAATPAAGEKRRAPEGDGGAAKEKKAKEGKEHHHHKEHKEKKHKKDKKEKKEKKRHESESD